MKKIFSLLCITIMVSTTLTVPAYATENQSIKPQTFNQQTYREQRKKEFEQRLNLNEKQKEKAKEIHKAGKEQIKPVIIQIELKRQEIEAVKLSRMAIKAQEEKINQLQQEITQLEKQAQEIRKKNSQEFEKLLNKKQKAELDKMKAEGRARYEERHKARPPFQGLGTPNFLLRPLLPPPPQNNHLLR